MKREYSLRSVASRRNSECGSENLAWLDFANWRTDLSVLGRLYLHVRSVDGETWHRVHCRLFDPSPRLAMRNGTLCWLVKREAAR